MSAGFARSTRLPVLAPRGKGRSSSKPISACPPSPPPRSNAPPSPLAPWNKRAPSWPPLPPPPHRFPRSMSRSPSARAARSNRRSAPRWPPWPAWASSPSTTPAPASRSAAPREPLRAAAEGQNIRSAVDGAFCRGMLRQCCARIRPARQGKHAATLMACSGRRMNIFLLRAVPFETFPRLRSVAWHGFAQCLRRQRILHRTASPKRHPAGVPHASAHVAGNHLSDLRGCTAVAQPVSTAATLFATKSIAFFTCGNTHASLASDNGRRAGGRSGSLTRSPVAGLRGRCRGPSPSGRSR